MFFQFERDMRKEGWKLEEDVKETQPLLPNKLELISYLSREEKHIKGGEFVERAKKMEANLGQRQAEYLIKHRNEMPKEWRQYNLFFPGTVWRDHSGDRYSPYLIWNGKFWYLHLCLLDDDFHLTGRLLRPRK